ncbi:hypothetical protein L6452_23119 [Arctium lappa]|uniref:Uncharacterized protein n=1 Tax=Arctium lappa TaxID=4217 RepID=A0ACB9B1H9_ARCLA|nr:hypothetical protein L6452_23119 [Arctium lappa]
MSFPVQIHGAKSLWSKDNPRLLHKPYLALVSPHYDHLLHLNGFMLSKELDEGAVEMEEGCSGSTTIEVTDGSFSWDDDAAEGGVVNHLNFKVKKGEL